jgi:hypothetical protein
MNPTPILTEAGDEPIEPSPRGVVVVRAQITSGARASGARRESPLARPHVAQEGDREPTASNSPHDRGAAR